jgi:hypothetical protein
MFMPNLRLGSLEWHLRGGRCPVIRTTTNFSISYCLHLVEIMSPLFTFVTCLPLQTVLSTPMSPSSGSLAGHTVAASKLSGKTSNFMQLTSRSSSRSNDRARKRGTGFESLRDLEYNSRWAAEAKIGGNTVLMSLDTGSSDTWVVAPDWQCLNSTGGSQPEESACNTGPVWNGNLSPTPSRCAKVLIGCSRYCHERTVAKCKFIKPYLDHYISH